MQTLFTTLVILTCLAFNQLVAAQIVSPFATHDCSNQVFSTGDHACKNDLTKCCAATGICCAGGCCPYDAYCVFVGTAKEACCSLSDKTQCGAAPPPSTPTCPPAGAPSVPCSGVGSSWYCQPGCSCDNSRDHGCNCFTGNCVKGGSSASPSPAASSTSAAKPAPSLPGASPVASSVSDAKSAASSSSLANVVSHTTQGAATSSSIANGNGASTQTSVSASANSASALDGSSSTTSAAAAAGTTTKAPASGGSKLELTAWWGLLGNVVAFGVMIIL